MSDTIYEIFEDAQAYRVRISRLGEFVQQAEGFSSRADAEAWIAQAGAVDDQWLRRRAGVEVEVAGVAGRDEVGAAGRQMRER